MLWLLALVAAPEFASVPNPRVTHDGWVSDGAGLIDAASEARLEQRCQTLHERIDLEIAVVTLESVGPDARGFAVGLFNHWGVGDRDTDNGLLILIAKRERALETVTGDGLDDVITDAWIKSAQDRLAVPAFKRGDFGGGVEALLGEIERYLAEDAAGEGAPHSGQTATGPQPAAGGGAPPPPRQPATIDEPESDDGYNLWLMGLGVLGVGGAGGFGYARYRKWMRTCPTCKIDMALLDEVADDQYIDAGQRAEERLGSVDHRVFWCDRCDSAVIRRPRGRWFSGWKRCRQCRYKTMSRTSTTISAATYDSSGQMRIDESCEHCSYSGTSYRTIPRKTRPSTSSSSSSFGSSSGGGSSFGGGSSSGGGASSSW